ncbi:MULTISPECIES: DUF3991 and TOPRIM domain-containing protein [Bacillus]|uniref:DUF3991 and TOPRIM domain-containing protein n=1 Tax=Bacillus TaxID=1386 RepID=UPI002FFF303E
MAISKSLIEKAAAVDIVDFCEANNYAIEKVNEKYYRGVDHDSLMINRRKNNFQWYSRGEYGNSIDFVRIFFNKDFKEAVAMLTNNEYERASEVKIEEKKEFVYDVEHANNTNAVQRYLIEERGIDSDIVHALIKKGLIRQDVKQNCVFVWGETGKRVGADLQGTRKIQYKGKETTFKQILKNSKENYGFNISLGTPKEIYFFESPIDLLSYWSLNKKMTDCRLVSMNGVKEQTVMNFIKHTAVSRGVVPSNAYIGVDNDKAGQMFLDKIKQYNFTTNINFKNLIPNDNHIPEKQLSMYQKVANVYELDWRLLAAIHKAETNLSLTNDATNYYGYGKFFGRKLAPKEQPQEIDLNAALHQCAAELVAKEDLWNAMKSQDVDISKSLQMYEKTKEYYENYCDLGYLPVYRVEKDWNDKLKATSSKQPNKTRTTYVKKQTKAYARS